MPSPSCPASDGSAAVSLNRPAAVDSKVDTLETVGKNFNDTIDDICLRIGKKKLEKIYFVSLGDFLHYDNGEKATSSGTVMESGIFDFQTIFDFACELMISGVEKLSKYAPVEIVYISGNHDRVLGYTLAKAIEFYYRNNSNIVFDCGKQSRKFRKIGNSLIGWAHGDISKDLIGGWLQSEARMDWGSTKNSEVHCGHFHNQHTVVEKNGTIVRYLPTMAETDSWTYEKGFVGGIKSTVSFVWDKEIGLREMWFSNIG